MSADAKQPSTLIDVDLALGRGRFQFELQAGFAAGSTGIFGPTGAGKTTLLHMIAGLIRPDRGRIRCADRIYFDSERRIDLAPETRGIGLVFQENRLFPHLSVRENLLFGAARESDEPGGRANELATVARELEIDALLDRRPADLSGGERKRTALGRALLRKPGLLLLDEPFAALDARSRGRVQEFLQTWLAERQLPALIISHDPRVIAELCSEVLVLEEGRCVYRGSQTEFTDRDAR